MKIIAELSQLSNGQKYAHLTAMDEGKVCEPATMTLLDFVVELHPPADACFEKILSSVKAGEYVPNNPALSDFSVNDKLVWLCPPNVKAGSLLISNENIPEYSVDVGQPQCFLLEVFHSVRRHWLKFLRLVDEEGEQKWLGKRLELDVE